jgi:hypothetical protein
VPIDHPDPPDDSDTPGPPDVPRPPDGPGSPDAIPRLPPGPANREAAHLAYRDTVDRANAAYQEHAADSTGNEASGVGRDSWSEALPSLRAAWKEHQERNPEREQVTPQTHADGSWSSGETRALTPDQNTEVTRGYTRIRDIGEREIVSGILAVEAADPTRRLAGFDCRIKGEDRLKEKVADGIRTKGRTPEEALAEVADVVRFTYEYSENTYTVGVRNDVERLANWGFAKVELRNTWDDDQYKGINTRWREPESAVLFEVQFHTQASLEAKELTHKAYERIRSTPRDDERAELKEFQRRVNSIVPIPPGTMEIEDYPPGGT